MSTTVNTSNPNQEAILTLLDNLSPEKLVIVEQVIQRLSEQLKASDNTIKAIELELMNGHHELLWQYSKERQSPKTKLGAELSKLRAEIVAEGEPLLDWDDIEAEVKTKRGELA